MLSDYELEKAREWIADCQWADDIDAQELTEREVLAGIKLHYDGGLKQFKRDCE